MKKLCALLLALLFTLTSLTVSAESELLTEEYETLPYGEPSVEESLPGEWYADLQGLTVKLTLLDVYVYTLEIPGGQPVAGSWEIREDGMLYLEGSAGALLPLKDAIVWDAARLVFRREAPVGYIPAEVFTDAREGWFDGWWKSHFTKVGEGSILSSAIGEDTAIYVEGNRAALAGKLFGEQVTEFKLVDGALTAEIEGADVTLQFQEDGFLRLTRTFEGETRVLYLMPTPDPFSA